MNARSQVFELTVEGRQIEEVVASIFHTLMFHRTFGKFHYKQEGSYSIGTLGMEDVDCDFVDFTYIQVSSAELVQSIAREIKAFRDAMRSADGSCCGEISLEFYQKKRARWLLSDECLPWEVWTIKLDVITLANEHERQVYREKVGEILADKILCITEAINKHEYVPKIPNQSELDLVFDTSYTDIQPYLFKISHQNNGPASSSVSTTMKKFLKDTLAL